MLCCQCMQLLLDQANAPSASAPGLPRASQPMSYRSRQLETEQLAKRHGRRERSPTSHSSPASKKLKAQVAWNTHNLYRARLCKYFIMGRPHCKREERCNYAHSLWQLLAPPDKWNYATTDLWNPGEPEPDPESMQLIMRYATEVDKESWPDWVTILNRKTRARNAHTPHRQQASGQASGSSGQHQRQESRQASRQAPVSSDVPRQRQTSFSFRQALADMGSESQSSVTPRRGPVNKVAFDTGLGPITTEAWGTALAMMGWRPDDQHLPDLATYFKSSMSLGTVNLARGMNVQVILGTWRDIRTLGADRRIVSVRCLPIKDRMSHQDLQQHLANFVTVDLAPWTEIRPKGRMYSTCDPEWQNHHGNRTSVFDRLVVEFDTILDHLTLHAPVEAGGRKKGVLWFWCHRGRHRSAALLAMFLMHATHSHTWVIPGCIAHLKRDVAYFDSTMVKKHQVPFRDVISHFARYLDETNPEHDLDNHRWGF